MPLRFPRTSNIRSTAGWQTALTSPNFGNPTLCEYDEMFEIMQRIRRWAARSRTAQAIFKFLDEAKPVIHVIGMKSGGYTCFDSDAPTVGAGTCYVDVEANFSIKSTGEDLHRYIAILHELGHAKQWVEMPGWFEIMGRNTAKVDFLDLRAEIVNRATPKPKTPEPVMATSESVMSGPPPPPPSMDSAGPTRMQIQSEVLKKLALPSMKFSHTHAKWPFMIEQDNMARHEWPICDEARYPRRAGYSDLAVTYG